MRNFLINIGGFLNVNPEEYSLAEPTIRILFSLALTQKLIETLSQPVGEIESLSI